MSDVVLDASALLAVLHDEAGGDHVAPRLAGALVSAVNHAEVLTRIVDRGTPLDVAVDLLAALEVPVVPFDESLSTAAAALRPTTRHLGLSLGDRACLALALARSAPVLTADRAWRDLAVGVEVIVIR